MNIKESELKFILHEGTRVVVKPSSDILHPGWVVVFESAGIDYTLQTSRGQPRIFSSLDAAVALLRKYDVKTITLSVNY